MHISSILRFIFYDIGKPLVDEILELLSKSEYTKYKLSPKGADLFVVDDIWT